MCPATCERSRAFADGLPRRHNASPFAWGDTLHLDLLPEVDACVSRIALYHGYFSLCFLRLDSFSCDSYGERLLWCCRSSLRMNSPLNLFKLLQHPLQLLRIFIKRICSTYRIQIKIGKHRL